MDTWLPLAFVKTSSLVSKPRERCNTILAVELFFIPFANKSFYLLCGQIRIYVFLQFRSIFFFKISQKYHFVLSCFIASFAFVLQRHRATPIPLCRAGVYSRRFIGLNLSLRRDASIFRFAQCQVCFANIAPALRCNPIITQIGRENNISAEICWCVCRGGVSPPVLSLKIGCSREGRPLPYNLVIQTSL